MNCITLRHQLHRYPELSNLEEHTSERLLEYFAAFNCEQIISGIGGNGLAFCFGDQNHGKTVMIRCELDALPIAENNTLDYCSSHEGISHKCGHDGHMAIIAAVAEQLSVSPPVSGRVILLFQPAEETGDGAKRVLVDEKFIQLKPDFVFALHNVPGFAIGEVVLKSGTFCCASIGKIIRLKGNPAHAAQPETGNSPVTTVAELLLFLAHLPSLTDAADSNTFATVVGVNVGEKSFGVAPSEAQIYVTLRSESDQNMQQMETLIEARVAQLCRRNGLRYTLDSEDQFDATINHPQAVDVITQALACSTINTIEQPFRWSEDFGQFSQHYCGAIFGLGAGFETPALHDSDYDFPDELITIGRDYFLKIIQQSLI